MYIDVGILALGPAPIVFASCINRHARIIMSIIIGIRVSGKYVHLGTRLEVACLLARNVSLLVDHAAAPVARTHNVWTRDNRNVADLLGVPVSTHDDLGEMLHSSECGELVRENGRLFMKPWTNCTPLL